MTKNILRPAVARIESVKLFDAYLEKYNQCQTGWNTRLRNTHKALFGKMVELLDYQYRDANKRFGDKSIANPDFGYTLTVSSFVLGKYLKYSSSTVRSHINRLRDAGVILRTVNHGQTNAPDLILNPKYLKIGSIYDLFASGSIPAPPLPQNVSSAEYCIKKEDNNIINTTDEVSQSEAKRLVEEIFSEASLPDKSVLLREHENVKRRDAESCALLREGTQEQERSSQEHSGKQKIEENIRAYSQKIKKSEEMFRAKIMQYALLFMTLASDKYLFWKDRKDKSQLYAGAFDASVDYIAHNYFSTCHTELELQRTLKLYEERFKMVVAWKRRKKMDLQWPEQFFNVNNDKGFRTTKLWLKKLQLYTKIKTANNAKSDTDRLMGAVDRVKKDKKAYVKERNYIKYKAPHLLRQFEMMIVEREPKKVA